MKRKLEVSELIFKIISYTLLTVFALACLYPFVYAVSASLSGRHAVEYGEVVLFPKDVQFQAFARMFREVAVTVPEVASAEHRGIRHRSVVSTSSTCHFFMFLML